MRGAGVEEIGAADGARLRVSSLGALALDERTGGSSGGVGARAPSCAETVKFLFPFPGPGRVHGFHLALTDEYKDSCVASMLQAASKLQAQASALQLSRHAVPRELR